MPGFFPPISLLNISVYRLQPRLFLRSTSYYKKNFEIPGVITIVMVLDQSTETFQKNK
jgi:hypothetical protein